MISRPQRPSLLILNLPDRLGNLAPNFRGAGLPIGFIYLSAKRRVRCGARTVPTNHQACSFGDFQRHAANSLNRSARTYITRNGE